MIKVVFHGREPVYVPVKHTNPLTGGLILGLNLFPGAQEITIDAWLALQNHADGRQLLEDETLERVPADQEAPAPVVIESPDQEEGEGEGTGEGDGSETDPATVEEARLQAMAQEEVLQKEAEGDGEEETDTDEGEED